MNILLPDSWLRDYIKTDATPKDIAKALSLHAFSVEKMETTKDGDVIYEIETTPNRGDALSVVGIARELRAILPRSGFSVAWQPKTFPVFSPGIQDSLEVVIANKALVPRFSAVVLENIKIVPSSELIQSRLQKVGIRPINAVVDMTNYLMIELGQPMHVFDYDKIEGAKMIVRESKEGEVLTTLDGVERKLPEGVIVIEDGSGRLIDLCGIMGAENSDVDETTQKVLFFVQVYDPVKIRKASMTLGHRTDAALRFEKGIDFEGVIPGLYAGVQMLQESLGVVPSSALIDIVNIPYTTDTVELDYAKISAVAGVDIPKEIVDRTLVDLGFELEDATVKVPSWRKGDIALIEDIAEEVIRIYGYYNIPDNIPTGEIPNVCEDKTFYWEDRTKDYLKYMGFYEVYTTSATSKELAGNNAIELSNPLSEDFRFLRTTLTSQLIDVVERNRGLREHLKVFELAVVYLPTKSGLPDQPLHLAVAAAGEDYLKFKGFIEGLFEDFGIKDYPPFSVEVTKTNVVYAELNFDELVIKASKVKSYTPITGFNAIKEDLTLVLPQGVPYPLIEEVICAVDPRVVNVLYKDFYENKLTVSLEFLDTSRQITSEDTKGIRGEIVRVLGERFGITL